MACPEHTAEQKRMATLLYYGVVTQYIQAGIETLTPLTGYIHDGNYALSNIIRAVLAHHDYNSSRIDATLVPAKPAAEYLEVPSCEPEAMAYYWLAPAIPVLDPSGYVYEAVPSNYLPGVTASVYQKVWEEDMYGDITEQAVLWDAADYGQENPLITDEYGMYAWDVPQGLWQVKYEKEGYETVYSEWLPVPPPQLDINIAMTQSVPPSVQTVRGYEERIDITFDKFMLPAGMTTDLIALTQDGEAVAGVIELLNAEINPANESEQFVSKVRFVPAASLSGDDEIVLTVKKEVESYAGVAMTEDFVQVIAIQKEPKSLAATPVLEVFLNSIGTLDIVAAPQEAVAGRQITARSVSSAITTVTPHAILDAEGKATLQVVGELPGSTQIIVSLDGTDLQATVVVNVAIPLVMEQVQPPIASIASGATIVPNTEVTLMSATPDALIRYTLDESSTPVWLDYSQPIVITEDCILRAKAIKEGMLDSEVAVYAYFIAGVGIPPLAQPVLTIYVRDRVLFIRGLASKERYTVYSLLGNVIASGTADDTPEQSLVLPNRGVFIVSTPRAKIKVLVP
jgi:hypothetical protein